MKKQIFAFLVFMLSSILFNSFVVEFSIGCILETTISFISGFYICQIGIFGRNKSCYEIENDSRLKRFLQIFLGILFLAIATYMFLKTHQEIYMFIASAAFGILTSGVISAVNNK